MYKYQTVFEYLSFVEILRLSFFFFETLDRFAIWAVTYSDPLYHVCLFLGKKQEAKERFRDLSFQLCWNGYLILLLLQILFLDFAQQAYTL